MQYIAKWSNCVYNNSPLEKNVKKTRKTDEKRLQITDQVFLGVGLFSSVGMARRVVQHLMQVLTRAPDAGRGVPVADEPVGGLPRTGGGGIC